MSDEKIVKRFGVDVKLNKWTYDKTIRENAKWISFVGLACSIPVIIIDLLIVGGIVSFINSYNFSYQPVLTGFVSIFFNGWWTLFLTGFFVGIRPEVVKRTIASKVFIKKSFNMKDLSILIVTKILFIVLMVLLESLIV